MLKIFCDGGARGNPGPAASAIVVSKDGKVIFKNSKYLGVATNNVAEYNAVLLGLNYLEKNPSDVTFVLDSELVTNQLSGNFKVKNENLKKLFQGIKFLENKLKTKISYTHVLREKNRLADFLVNKALDENS